MTRIDFKQDILPHLLAIAVFLVIQFVYFKPAIFEGKQLRQDDRLLVQGAAKELVDTRAETGDQPLWTTTSFSGMPTYLLLNPPTKSLNRPIDSLFRLGLPYPISIPLVAMLSFYILLSVWGFKPWTSAVGAIAFSMATFVFVSLEVGHNSKLNAMAYSALVMAGVVAAFQKRYMLGIFLAAIGMAMHVLGAHYQITWYLMFIILFFGLSELISAIKSKELPHFGKAVGVLIIGVAIGMMTNSTRLLTTLEYTPYSMRGGSELKKGTGDANEEGLEKSYIFRWSYGVGETLNLLIPRLYGGSNAENVPEDSQLARNYEQFGYYWGSQPSTAGPAYLGAIVIFLFVLGLLVLEGRTKWWMLAVVIYGLFLAMGSNFAAFNYFLYEWMPLFDKFRAVTMAHYIPQFVMAIAAAFTLKAVMDAEDTKAIQRKLYIAAGIVGGIALLFFMAPGLAGSFEGPMDARMLSSLQDPAQRQAFAEILYEDRRSMASADALRSLTFILMAGAVLWLATNRTLKPWVATMLVGGLIVIDLGGVDKRYLNNEDFGRRVEAKKFVPTAANQAILTDQEPYFRVINLLNPWNDGITPYYHKTVGGYSPAKMQRYQELIEQGLAPEQRRLISALQSQSYTPELMQSLPVHNMLHTKYFIVGEAANAVIPNPNSLGNGWFVQNVQYVNGPDAELAGVATPGFNPATTAIIDQDKFQVSATRFDSLGGTIQLTDYTPTSISYQTNSPKGGLAVLSEVYYPKGWEVEMDGQILEADKLIRVNYVLRALEVPAGQHTIVMRFKSQSFANGVILARISSVLLILLVLGLGFQVYRNFRKPSNIEEA